MDIKMARFDSAISDRAHKDQYIEIGITVVTILIVIAILFVTPYDIEDAIGLEFDDSVLDIFKVLMVIVGGLSVFATLLSISLMNSLTKASEANYLKITEDSAEGSQCLLLGGKPQAFSVRISEIKDISISQGSVRISSRPIPYDVITIVTDGVSYSVYGISDASSMANLIRERIATEKKNAGATQTPTNE